jgi:hypothetical protein
MVYSGFFFGNLFGSPCGALVLDLLTIEVDGVIQIDFLPTIMVAGMSMFASSLLILKIKLTLGNGSFFANV